MNQDIKIFLENVSQSDIAHHATHDSNARSKINIEEVEQESEPLTDGAHSFEEDEETKHTPLKTETSKVCCEICSESFQNEQELEDHVLDIHVVDKDFQCSKCSKSFISPDKLESHVKEDHEQERSISLASYLRRERNKCRFCAKTFDYKTLLDSHILTHYPGLRKRSRSLNSKLKCEVCSEPFVERRFLTAHQTRAHGFEKPFKCLICAKTFASNYALQNHLRLHSDAKNFSCELCRLSFKTKYQLQNHSKSKHAKEND